VNYFFNYLETKDLNKEKKVKDMEENRFEVIVLGIIFNPKEKKILIGKRENDPEIKELTWYFPGGKLQKEKILIKH